MAKVKLTKTELKAQTDALKRFQRFLPMLQLKKQQLQGEIAGIVQKGTVSKTTSASRLAGKAWNAPDTYYTIRNKVFPGNQMDAAHIENGMCVWMKK